MSGCPLCHRENVPAAERTPDGWCKGWALVECDFVARVALGVPVGIARRERAAAYRRLRERTA